MIIPLVLISTVALSDTTIPLSSRTFSADSDSRWVLAVAAGTPGNQWYIAGPEGDRTEWLAQLQASRNVVREQIHGAREVEIDYQGVRAWVRMTPGFAKTADLAPGEPFQIDLEARWIEGNNELVLALDLHSRETDAKLGWSEAFSTIDIPKDREWHGLTWTGELPDFDSQQVWVKPIVGMDATHDPTPGNVLLRELSFHVPARAETAVARYRAFVASFRSLPGPGPTSTPTALNRAIYDRPDLKWASRAFVCHFTFMYDLSFFDPVANDYRLDGFLREGDERFGGYDAVVLWQAYPRIGLDERNQFDFYRDMPGGLRGLRKLVRGFHKRGVKVFIDYNPWDTGTRREAVSDDDAIAQLLADIRADGVFLDTMSAGASRLRTTVDDARKGVVFEPEGSPPVDQLEICSLSWAQWLPEVSGPGLLRLKWIEPRHMQHQIRRWNDDHSDELEAAFFNGSGVMVWENVFGTSVPWSGDDSSTLRTMAPILRAYADNFTSDGWDPFVPTLLDGVYANRWPGERATIYTILNRTGSVVREPFIRIRVRQGERVFDLWRGRELTVAHEAGHAVVDTRLGRIGCIAVCPGPPDVGGVSLRVADRRSAREPSLFDPIPADPSPAASLDSPPPGMALIPAGSVTMDLVHQYRECGCYPDPGTPPERWRDFAWGAPWHRSLEHHIGPTDLPAYFIDRHEVTNAEFEEFLRESGYAPRDATNFLKHWGGSSPPAEFADHPVVYVDMADARAYAKWAGKRLPTEPEWHRAAQGDDGRAWPWGDEFDASRCNGSSAGTVPVGSLPSGRSPFGCDDMSGNVWEWTEGERSDGHTRFTIIRGGSYFRAEGSGWYMPGGAQPNTHHAKFILMYPGLDRCSTVGFRCVKDIAR